MFGKNKKYSISQNNVIELKFISKKHYKNPFEEINLDVYFTDPDGNKIKVPAFWSGKNIWRVRYSSDVLGKHNFITQCSNKDDGCLNDNKGVVVVKEYKGKNSLYKHGALKVNAGGDKLEHSDGTSFLWLADTWWFALIKSMQWPNIFKKFVKDRVKKGFNVIQLVVGFIPGVKIFDPFAANEAGYPFYEDLKSINPYFFDFADKKIKWLVHEGMVPCIFGSWWNYMDDLGIDNMKKFWKYIIARWGAYPVVWCIAGEVTKVPEKTSKESISDKGERKKKEEATRKWAEVGKYIRIMDPFNHLITIHPTPGSGSGSYSCRDVFKDSSLYDIDMLQTSHGGTKILEVTLEKIKIALNSKPVKPVINGEVCYEGIYSSCWQDVQRFLFWSHMLSGTAGHTYGAAGVYDFDYISKEEKGLKWDSAHWKDGINFPGSYQLGIGKKFLEKFEWSRFESHPEWVEPNCIEKDIYYPYCAGIPKKIRIVYFPVCFTEQRYAYRKIKINNIEDNTDYMGYFFNPRNGSISKAKNTEINENGEFVLGVEEVSSVCPTLEDWVLVLENKKEGNIINI